MRSCISGSTWRYNWRQWAERRRSLTD